MLESNTPPPLETNLTDDEVKMFEHIKAMEMVHNELGANLGAFKDSIMQTRNEFVKKVATKYKVENPNQVTYDPKSKKLISIFHQNMPFVKIKEKPAMFTQLASDMMFKAISTLTNLYKANK